MYMPITALDSSVTSLLLPSTECPKIYSISVLHLPKYTANLYLLLILLINLGLGTYGQYFLSTILYF